MAKSNHKTDNPLLKECFFTALIMLMDQKDFKDITISEIAQKAGVSRMTYYRTYSSKEDILLQYFSDLTKQTINKLKNTPDVTVEQFAVMFFSDFKEYAHLLKYLYQAGLVSQMLDRFTDFLSYLYFDMGNPPYSKSEMQYQIRFVAGGFFMLLYRWQETGLKESPEEMAKLTVDILSGKYHFA